MFRGSFFDFFAIFAHFRRKIGIFLLFFLMHSPEIRHVFNVILMIYYLKLESYLFLNMNL